MMRLVLTLLLALLAQGCGRGEEATETAAAPPVRVRVVQARRGEIRAVLEVTGEVEGLRILRLASPVAGRVTFLAARPGDRIAEGEVAARGVPLESEAALHGLAVLEGAAALGVEERRAVARLRSQSTDIPLRAAFAALVTDRFHNPGDQVASGDVLLAVFDLHALDVLAQLPLTASAWVSP